MARGKSTEDLATLQMALVGYQIEKQKIDDRIRELQARLKGKSAAPAAPAAEPSKKPVKRILSPEARERIAAAQRKRWAEHRKGQAKQAKEAAKA
jgi:hypothetical protein